MFWVSLIHIAPLPSFAIGQKIFVQGLPTITKLFLSLLSIIKCSLWCMMFPPFFQYPLHVRLHHLLHHQTLFCGSVKAVLLIIGIVIELLAGKK